MTIGEAFAITPLESLYFGAPSSMLAGEAHHGASQFPPSPWAFQGLVRSRLIDGSGVTVRDPREAEALVGGPDALREGWQLRGPLPARRSGGRWEPWLPGPRFLFRSDEAADTLEVARVFEPALAGCSDVAPEGERCLVGVPGRRTKGTFDGWISAACYLHLIGGGARWATEGAARDLPPFVRRERHYGLKLGPEHVAADRMLYARDSLRFGDGGALVGWLDADLEPPLRFEALESGSGGAGRGARRVLFEPARAFDPAFDALLSGAYLQIEGADVTRFWALAISPVPAPQDGAPELSSLRARGFSVSSIATLAGPPVTLGGYKMATGESRPNRAYLPAGSAWLYELRGGSADERRRALLETVHARAALAEDSELARFGFGWALVAADAQRPLR